MYGKVEFLKDVATNNPAKYDIILRRLESSAHTHRNTMFWLIYQSLSEKLANYGRAYLALKIEISLHNQAIEMGLNYDISYCNVVANFIINLGTKPESISTYLYDRMIDRAESDTGTYMNYCRESIQDVLDDIESRDKIVPTFSELVSCPFCKNYTCSTTLVQKRAIDEPASVNGWCYTCCKGFQG